MAGVAKWLRQWVVIPPFAGSSPVTRPYLFKIDKYLFKKFYKLNDLCHVIEDPN